MKRILYLILTVVLNHMTQCEDIDQCKSALKILNNYYIANVVMNFNNTAPKQVDFVNGRILYILDQETFILDEDLSGTSSTEYVLGDFEDHYVVRGRGNVYFREEEIDDEPQRADLYMISNNRIMVQYIDNLALVLDLPFKIEDGNYEKLYALNKDNLVMTGKIVETEYIKELGDKVVHFKINPITGDVILSTATKQGGSLILLQSINCQNSTTEVKCLTDQDVKIDRVFDDIFRNASVQIDALFKVQPTKTLVQLDDTTEEEMMAQIEQLKAELIAARENHEEFIDMLSMSTYSDLVDGISDRFSKDTLICAPEDEINSESKKFHTALRRSIRSLDAIQNVMGEMGVKRAKSNKIDGSIGIYST